MRLFIKLNEDIDRYEILPEDLVLTNTYDKKQKGHVIYIDNWNISDTNSTINSQLANELKKLPFFYSNLINDIAVSVFKPVFRVIYQIEKLLETYPIDDIHLFGGNDYLFSVSENAEGEAVRKYYSSAWLYNHYIYVYFKHKVTVIWNRDSRFLMLLRFKTRSFYYFLWDLAYSLFRNFRLCSSYNFNGKTKEKALICFSNLALQYRHLYELCNNSKYRCYFINNRHINTSGTEILDELRIKTTHILGFLFKLIKCDSKIIIKINYNGVIFEFPVNHILEGFKGRAMVNLCETERVRLELKKIQKNISIVACITDMTVGHDIINVNEATKVMNVPHINIQHVTMLSTLYPRMKLADKYYLYGKKTYEVYKTKDDSYQFYNPVKSINVNKQRNRARLVATIFTQPEAYTDRYLKAIADIFKYFKGCKQVMFQVKLHYRQDKVNEFREIVALHNNSLIIDGNATDIIKSSDFIISMTSSVVFEAFTFKVPAVIINFDKIDDSVIKENDVCVAEVNKIIEQPSELGNIIDNYDDFYKEYCYRWENAQNMGDIKKSIDDFI